MDQTGADPAAVRAAVERAEELGREVDRERAHAAAENAEAQRLMMQADQADRVAEAARDAAELEPDPTDRERAQVQAHQEQGRGNQPRADGASTYDSAERREGMGP